MRADLLCAGACRGISRSYMCPVQRTKERHDFAQWEYTVKTTVRETGSGQGNLFYLIERI